MTDRPLFHRTQVVWPGVVPIAIVGVVLTWTFFQAEYPVGLGVAIVVLCVSLVLFATLTVIVTGDRLLARFGVGVFRKRINFGDVVSFTRVRNSWMDGWGIHTYPGGMLYNASGLSAVEFKLADGRYVCIGTDEPDALVAAVQRATRKSEAPSAEPRSARARTASRTIGVAIAVVALTLAGVMIYFGVQPPTVAVTEDEFRVSGAMYSNTVVYSAMQSVALQDGIPPIRLKTNGFAAGNTLRGSFNVAGWGNGRLYVNRDMPPFVVIRAGNGFVVVNFKDPAQTRALYADLTARLDRSRQ